ncbi:MAG: 6-bladed beta-propeller [Candidatus Aminicenantales bacterium]
MSHPRILTVLLFSALSVFLFLYGQKETDFKVIEEDGIPVAINPDHPIPVKDSPKEILFEEEFKIGSTEGDPNYIFGAFISFTVDDHGHVYVLDWREKTVRKFDHRGEYLFRFGDPGQGPGEFSSPEEIRYLPNGQLMIFEGESQKYSCFTKDGQLARTGRFQKLMFSPYFGLTNGHIIATNVLYESDKTEYTLGIYNERCDLVNVLYRWERKADPPWPKGGDQNARARRLAEAISRVAFRPSNLLALDSREDIYFAFTAKYEIKILQADGRLNKIIRTELPCLPVREKDRRVLLDARLPEDISTWRTMDEPLRNKIKEMIKFPEKMPAFLSLIPMDDNYLMVVRSGHYGQNALIDIFDSSGRFIIEKELSFNINQGICRGRRLYTIHKDEDGNRYIKCYSYQLIR